MERLRVFKACLRRAHAAVCYWITRCLTRTSATRTFAASYIDFFWGWGGLNGNTWHIFFIVFVSLRAVSRSHQSTVASSAEIRHNVGFGCRLDAIYCCSTLFKWPDFSEGRNSSQFFIAWKAGYNHPPPLDSWRQLIIRRPKTDVWCFYLVREAQLYQAIPRRLFLYKEILSPTGWDLICL